MDLVASGDRAGNPRSYYRDGGGIKVHDRHKYREGNMPGEDEREADLGRAAGEYEQGKPGLKGTSLPMVTVKEAAEHEPIVAAVNYLRGIEDSKERKEITEHFARMFEGCHDSFSRSLFFELVNMSGITDGVEV
jgi:hypothetical protein